MKIEIENFQLSANEQTLEARNQRERQNLETMVEASGPVRPSNVTTSNPTLSLPCLISPINNKLPISHYQRNWKKLELWAASITYECRNLEPLSWGLRLWGFRKLSLSECFCLLPTQKDRKEERWWLISWN